MIICISGFIIGERYLEDFVLLFIFVYICRIYLVVVYIYLIFVYIFIYLCLLFVNLKYVLV